MYTIDEFIEKLNRRHFDKTLAALYGADAVDGQKIRYKKLAEDFTGTYEKQDGLFFFSSPGRVEIVGNHTDHNNGCVLAGTVDLDIIGAVRKNGCSRVQIMSEGFPGINVGLDDLNRRTEEYNTPAALARGVSADLKAKGYAVGGFDAYFSSGLQDGAGISSSASFEIMTGAVYNYLFNSGGIPFDQIAQAGMTAETKYFGKPSGLMDQMVIAAGGVVFIDFRDPQAPVLERIPFRFGSMGLAICLVDTKGSHSELTDEYASIPKDMRRVAEALGKPSMREATYRELLDNFQYVREKCGDKAVLRALHFIDENQRAASAAAAVKSNRKEEFLKYVNESGASSALYLQNIYREKEPQSQNVMIALYLAGRILRGKGAWRVHGGGFGGTTFNLVPFELTDAFASVMEQAFGKGCCRFLEIRPAGSICIKENCDV